MGGQQKRRVKNRVEESRIASRQTKPGRSQEAGVSNEEEVGSREKGRQAPPGVMCFRRGRGTRMGRDPQRAFASDVFDERAVLQFLHGLLELILRIHHDGSVPGHGLFERSA